MRRFLAFLPVAALSLLWLAPPAYSQEKKSSRGTLTAMSTDSITVKIGVSDMQFRVDDKTTVEATGAGTKTRAAQAAGKATPKLADLLKVGDAVEVTFAPTGNTSNYAERIRKVTAPGSGGVPANRLAGTVTAISADSLTIHGTRGGGSTVDRTFLIDAKTRLVARGAGTATAKSGKVAATDIIATGDQVSVSYRDEGGKFYASDVRVTAKATK